MMSFSLPTLNKPNPLSHIGIQRQFLIIRLLDDLNLWQNMRSVMGFPICKLAMGFAKLGGSKTGVTLEDFVEGRLGIETSLFSQGENGVFFSEV